jgi:hypothetical protein
MLVALLGDRPAVGVSQQALAAAESAPAFAVGEEVPHQCRRYGLPAYCLAFLAQPDQALFRVQVVRRQREGAAAAARGFHVLPQQERVQGRSCPAAACGFTQVTQGCAGNGTISNHRQDAEQRVRSPHRNPTSPDRDAVSPQVSHRQNGIPRHTAAHLLRWPCQPVTSLYADQAGRR